MSLRQPSISSIVTAFDSAARNSLQTAYPDQPAKLAHLLVNHPLLTLPALAELAGAMNPESIEYNRGDLPLGLKPEETPANGLTLAETIRTIERNGSWVVLKNVERHPAYAGLLDQALSEIRPIIEVCTGPMLHQEAFIFISSPTSVTPFHMDPEHNILLQIRGEKIMTIFSPHDDELISSQQSETFALGGHRNLVWREEFAERGSAIHLQSGDAVYIPVKAPHFVKNGEAVSVSLSITWRSARSVAESELHGLNARLRKRKLPLVRIGRVPEKQWIGRILYRLVNRMK